MDGRRPWRVYRYVAQAHGNVIYTIKRQQDRIGNRCVTDAFQQDKDEDRLELSGRKEKNDKKKTKATRRLTMS